MNLDLVDFHVTVSARTGAAHFWRTMGLSSSTQAFLLMGFMLPEAGQAHGTQWATPSGSFTYAFWQTWSPRAFRRPLCQMERWTGLWLLHPSRPTETSISPRPSWPRREVVSTASRHIRCWRGR